MQPRVSPPARVAGAADKHETESGKEEKGIIGLCLDPKNFRI